MDETIEKTYTTPDDKDFLFTMRLKLEEEGITNEIEVNCGFMSHLKRHPEEMEYFLDEFSRKFRKYVEDAE